MAWGPRQPPWAGRPGGGRPAPLGARAGEEEEEGEVERDSEFPRTPVSFPMWKIKGKN